MNNTVNQLYFSKTIKILKNKSLIALNDNNKNKTLVIREIKTGKSQ